MIRIDGSGRDGMEEEKVFPLTYSSFFSFLLLLSFFFLFHLLLFK